MLTPQDITEKAFVKAVFGGYDMEGVDDFLEAVSADYNTLYKENAILKGKLKVLVEKVEEYRKTEDALRMALLTAQCMGEEITTEANRTKDELLQSAENEIKAKLSDTATRIAEEEMRLAAASKETAKFIELSKAILSKHSEFLKKLETAHRTITPKSAPTQTAPEHEPAEVLPQPASQEQPVMPAQPPEPVQSASPPSPVQQPPPPGPAHPADINEIEFDDIAEAIGSAVADIANLEASSAPAAMMQPTPPDEPPSSLFEDNDAPLSLYSNDAEPDMSPRPKFDFDDLKFGANFESDD